MRISKINILLIPLLLACSHQPTDDEGGRQMLDEARVNYANGNYPAARDSILVMRQRFPLALEARRQAILLMDSIELQLAQGDSLKSEFFRRKLQHDKEELEIKE